MHIVASKPQFVRREEVPESVVTKEKNFLAAQAKEDTSLGSTALASRQGMDSARWTMNMLPSGQTPVTLADPAGAALTLAAARARAHPIEQRKRTAARTIESTPSRNSVLF